MHHQVKHLPGWTLVQDRGRFIWTTPNGIRFIVYPPPDDDGEDDHPDFLRLNPTDDLPPF